VLAADPEEKAAWQGVALEHWLRAARFESPHAEAKGQQAARNARATARRLEELSGAGARGQLFRGIGHILDGELEAARTALATAGDDAQALRGGLEATAREVEIGKLFCAAGAGTSQAERTRAAADARKLATTHPPQALALLILGQSLAPEPLARAEGRLEQLRRSDKAPGRELRAADIDLTRVGLLAGGGPEAQARALQETLRLATDAPDAEQRWSARLCEAELRRQGGDLDGAIEAARTVWKTAAGPTRRGLAATYLAALHQGRGTMVDLAFAEQVLSQASAELDPRMGSWLQRASEVLGRFASALRGEQPLGPERAPGPDEQAVLGQLLTLRAQVAEAQGLPERARRLLTKRPPGDHTAPGKESLGEQARALALAPLAATAGIPVRALLDGHLMGPPPGPTPPVTLGAQRLAFSQAQLGPLPQSAEDALSVATRAPGVTPFRATLASLTLAQEGVHGGQGSLTRSLGRELVAASLVQPDRGGSDALSAFRADDRTLLDAARTVRLGLARPGATQALGDLLRREGFEASLPHQRPTARQTLEAASVMGRAARVLARPAAGGLTDARLATAAELRGALEGLSSAETAQALLTERGFAPAEEGWLGRGEDRVRVSAMEVGGAEGFSVELGAVVAGSPEPRERFVQIGGIRFEGRDWALFEHGRERELERYRRALHTRGGRTSTPTDIASLRRLISTGRPTESRPAKIEKRRELMALRHRASELIEELDAKGNLPRGVYVMVDGIDAASKTSNGEVVAELFKQAGFQGSSRSFKGPTSEELQDPSYLTRFDRHRPMDREVFLADRSPLGNFAYNSSLDATERAEMGREFGAWERDMQDDGVLVLKMLFHPGSPPEQDGPVELPELWRPMFTFGKRQARAEAARDVLTRLEASGVAPEALPPDLVEAANLGPGLNDLRSFHEGVQAHRRFAEAAELTAGDSENPWLTVETQDRHEGRHAVLRHLIAQLEAWKSRTGP
ncbi:MAG: hypothetical protein KC933_34390, partial [Myxococcales bacterium]|nr:hypothetical protein [Myxococcales bacterium]